MLLDRVEKLMHNKLTDDILPKRKVMGFHDMIKPITRDKPRNKLEQWSQKKRGNVRFRVYDEALD